MYYSPGCESGEIDVSNGKAGMKTVPHVISAELPSGFDGPRQSIRTALAQGAQGSFIRSHWMLPYPQNQGFMRKDEETKNLGWWPVFHNGLHKYFRRFYGYKGDERSLPASNVKHLPAMNGIWHLDQF